VHYLRGGSWDIDSDRRVLPSIRLYKEQQQREGIVLQQLGVCFPGVLNERHGYSYAVQLRLPIFSRSVACM
jgi:hypothetical protein